MIKESPFKALELPETVIGALYPTVIVVDRRQETVDSRQETVDKRQEEKSPPASLRWLGENNSAVTLVVNYTNETFMPDAQLQFLTKILEACKLNLGDVALVNAAKSGVSSAAIKEQLRPAKLILFGVDADQIGLPIRFPEFKLQAYDGTTYLQLPAADKMNGTDAESKLLKSKSWVCLKSLFNV